MPLQQAGYMNCYGHVGLQNAENLITKHEVPNGFQYCLILLKFA